MTRLAKAYGQAPRDFWGRVWPRISFREIDHHPPEALLLLLSSKTGTPYAQVAATTLARYEEYSMQAESVSRNGGGEHRDGSLYYRTCRGNAIRFSPQCLAEDVQPSFRRRWRLAFVTICERRDGPLFSECGNCGAPARYEKVAVSAESLASCCRCGQDLRRMRAPEILPGELSARLYGFQQRLLEIIEPVKQAATRARESSC